MMSGKEVYVAPSPDDQNIDDIDDETDPEQTQRLALARDIARRQSGQGRSWHGFDGFGRTHQFSEMGSPTHHLFEVQQELGIF